MAQETYSYRGYRLVVGHLGAGWKVFIYAPKAILAESEIPNTGDPLGRDVVLREAKAYVDRALGDSK